MANYLIVGATSGIGLAVTQQLLDEGQTVFGVGRNLQALTELQKKYPRLFTMKYDIQSLQSQTVIAAAHEKMGSIDVFFLNSGVASGHSMTDWLDAAPTVQTNVMGTTEVLINAFAYLKKDSRGGSIAVNTSVAGIRGLRQAPVYSASKAYLISLCQSLRSKIKNSSDKIHIIDIRPGFIDTPLAGGTFWMSSKEKAARQIIRAIENKKEIAYISRRWVLVATLMRLVPRALYERV